jgi:rubredoxin
VQTFLEYDGKKHPVYLSKEGDRIFLERAGFGLKDCIKTFRNPRWEGFKTPPRRCWSIDNCPRNLFQLRYRMGEDVYAWFDQPMLELDFERPVTEMQKEVIRAVMTYHFQIISAEMGLGKSLIAIECIERAVKLMGGAGLFVGPRSALESVQLECEKWGSQPFETSSYEGLHKIDFVPSIVIFDESSSLKNPTTTRAREAQSLADKVREIGGYVVCMSGTAQAKSPTDIWSQAEITFPGFIPEGSLKAYTARYANMVEMNTDAGITFQKLESWKEDEVAQIPRRLKGLQRVYRRAEWLELPTKTFRIVKCEPSKKLLRASKAIADIAPNTMTALTWLRALSSGFQYSLESGEETLCPTCDGKGFYEVPEVQVCPTCNGSCVSANQQRKVRFVDTPKVAALASELETCGDRIVIGASFQGSIDKVVETCHANDFDTCIVDGRGWRVVTRHGDALPDHPLRFWAKSPDKLAFVGNPGSCRYGLTLIEANKLVFFDQSFSAEHRLQFQDRIYRLGQSRPVEIVDLIHLPVDKLILDTLTDNRRLELLSLGKIQEFVVPDGD